MVTRIDAPIGHEDGNGTRLTSLRDVARAAGVSVSTASRVLSGSSHPVSKATQDVVRETAKRLGFEPNRVARALATARSQTIGVVVHDVSDPYFAEIVRGLEDVAGPRDHALFVSSSDRDAEKEVSLIRAFVANRVDAILLLASGLSDPDYMAMLDSALGRFERLGGVVVCMSEHSYAAPRVTYDNAGPMREVVAHLAGLGHRRIVFLAGPPDLMVGSVRLGGFRAGLVDMGLEFDPDLVETGFFSLEGGADATSRLWERARPTAIVGGNDLMAIGALRRLHEMGLDVPADVSVVGFDDVEFAAYAPVPLTTVHVPLAEFGRLGAGLVLDLLDGTGTDLVPSVRPELVVRASTGSAPA
jgi:LacI family transcriptional regulator